MLQQQYSIDFHAHNPLISRIYLEIAPWVMSFNYSTSMWFWFWINRRRNTDVLWETREKKTTLRCKANCWGRRKGITIDCGGVKLSFSVDSSRFSIKRAYCHMFIHIMAWLCSAVAHNRAARQSMCTVLCIHYDKFNSLPSHSSPIFVHLFILEFFFFFFAVVASAVRRFYWAGHLPVKT